MRILMLHPHDVRYKPWTIRIIKLAESLADFGHQVTVACVEDKCASDPRYPRLRELPEGKVEYVILRPRDKQTHKNIALVMDMAREVDIIHFQKCFPSVFIPAVWAAWRWKKPLHYDWDDNETLILKEIIGLPPGFFTQAKFFERRIPACVDTISVASSELGRICESMGFPPERIVKVPVGADLEAFSGCDGKSFRNNPPMEIGDRPLVSYIGQIEGGAYASLFIQACGQIADRFPDAVWLVVGGGLMLEKLEELACRLNVAHRIVFTDYVPSRLVPEILAATDIAVACFADETFVRCKSPLKVAEYLAAGKAIVASDVGEVPWMTGDAAVLVKPGDVDDLARGITHLLENREERIALGILARRRAEDELNWQVSAKKQLSAYQLALS
jgi:glycosyltransferase involved in cell wall biosynthesis